MIISLSGKEKWLPFDDQRGAVQMIKNKHEPGYFSVTQHRQVTHSTISVDSFIDSLTKKQRVS